MPRLILELGSGAQPASVSASVLSLAGVQDAREAAQANVVVVTVESVTADVRDRLARQPGVTGVHDDLQGIPQVADEREVEDFLDRVRDVRDDEDVPSRIQTKPLRTDGGAGTLPAPSDSADLTPLATGDFQDATATVNFSGAPALHEQGNRGENVIAVIVDTGSCGEVIRDSRQMAGEDLTDEDDPWTPYAPHGGMATGIMAGDETTPGVETGFLPDASVFPIKSTLAASELILAQDTIVSLAEQDDRTVVVNNSWGFDECAGICDHPVTAAIRNAASHPDVIQVFAAGNQGTKCGENCDGSTVGISGPNSLDEVITVGASGRNGDPAALHPYSSRGGPSSISCGDGKPDVTAPIYGTVPYGCGERAIGNNGGTSGACPHVAGAVGLLANDFGGAQTTDMVAALTASAEQFMNGDFSGCSGYGNVMAAAAVAELEQTGVTPPQTAGLGGPGKIAAIGITAGLIGAALRRRVSS